METLLTSFLEKAIAGKAERLAILTGINRLDDVARRSSDSAQVADDLGGWLAQYQFWLRDPEVLKTADRNRLTDILGVIQKELAVRDDSSPEQRKLSEQVNRWRSRLGEIGSASQSTRQSLTLRRPPEKGAAESAEPDSSIEKFGEVLQRLATLFGAQRGNRAHLLTILDDTLKKAELQQHPDSLLLAATMIYYLQHSGYLVGPYVARLKDAERAQREASHASSR